MSADRPLAGRDPKAQLGSLRLPRAARIRKTSEIRSLLKRGKRKRTDHLDVFFAPSPASRSRVGVIVPKHRHGIIERNWLRRRLRELERTCLLPALNAAGLELDVLLRARREAYGVPFRTLEREVNMIREVTCSEG